MASLFADLQQSVFDLDAAAWLAIFVLVVDDVDGNGGLVQDAQSPDTVPQLTRELAEEERVGL